ncbi:hypothetical protein F5Y16DRAFT_418143 [Xylariaceae sp. FL0255]|nr:hypothetical protein F5Y16DRAFT_418143 [Xylariaceae sp. FL0255]
MTEPPPNSTLPDPRFDASCPDGGSFYVCANRAVKFLGCCEENPCNDTNGDGMCPLASVRAAGYSVDAANLIPPQGCATNGTQASPARWYICGSIGSHAPFMGCCTSDACDISNGTGCSNGTVWPAVLSNNATDAAPFLFTNVTTTSVTTSSKPSASSTSPPASNNTSTNNSTQPHHPGTSHIGVAVGVPIAVVVILALAGLIYFRFFRKPSVTEILDVPRRGQMLPQSHQSEPLPALDDFLPAEPSFAFLRQRWQPKPAEPQHNTQRTPRHPAVPSSPVLGPAAESIELTDMASRASASSGVIVDDHTGEPIHPIPARVHVPWQQDRTAFTNPRPPPDIPLPSLPNSRATSIDTQRPSSRMSYRSQVDGFPLRPPPRQASSTTTPGSPRIPPRSPLRNARSRSSSRTRSDLWAEGLDRWLNAMERDKPLPLTPLRGRRSEDN